MCRGVRQDALQFLLRSRYSRSPFFHVIDIETNRDWMGVGNILIDKLVRLLTADIQVTNPYISFGRYWHLHFDLPVYLSTFVLSTFVIWESRLHGILWASIAGCH